MSDGINEKFTILDHKTFYADNLLLRFYEANKHNENGNFIKIASIDENNFYGGEVWIKKDFPITKVDFFEALSNEKFKEAQRDFKIVVAANKIGGLKLSKDMDLALENIQKFVNTNIVEGERISGFKKDFVMDKTYEDRRTGGLKASIMEFSFKSEDEPGITNEYSFSVYALYQLDESCLSIRDNKDKGEEVYFCKNGNVLKDNLSVRQKDHLNKLFQIGIFSEATNEAIRSSDIASYFEFTKPEDSRYNYFTADILRRDIRGYELDIIHHDEKGIASLDINNWYSDSPFSRKNIVELDENPILDEDYKRIKLRIGSENFIFKKSYNTTKNRDGNIVNGFEVLLWRPIDGGMGKELVCRDEVKGANWQDRQMDLFKDSKISHNLRSLLLDLSQMSDYSKDRFDKESERLFYKPDLSSTYGYAAKKIDGIVRYVNDLACLEVQALGRARGDLKEYNRMSNELDLFVEKNSGLKVVKIREAKTIENGIER